ncbi:OmpA family protein [Epibacterium sp. SM1979]|uniref:OmpA family protein n=1 Tax=Tritonibacter litoralis TaxID=2662264 RepID=A0A843YHL0_9RHOB|nr:OmpA family protein [Tritonibacter litoralis]MQQ08723.1 OmpA family protein [Tritonibacter litoralis]
MRLPSVLMTGATFATAAALSLVVAGFAATGMERGSESAVRQVLDDSGFGWAEVTADGLAVILEGTAPDEADRFAAKSQVATVVDGSRIIDRMQILPSRGIAPPQFSAEILRNEAGVSIIGLIPAGSDRAEIIEQMQDLAGTGQVADFLEPTTYAAPQGWAAALRFGLEALEILPSSKISVKPGAVAITANTNSPEEKARLENRLTRMAKGGLRLALDLKAPRPVITPFTLRFTLDESGGRFDACSADSVESRTRILKAATQAGLRAKAQCTIGMGVPSPYWAEAVEDSLASLAELGAGTVTLANADITLAAVQGTDQAAFDRVVGRLKSELPSVFALHAVLPEPEDAEQSTQPDFTATLSPEGQVLLRGQIADEIQHELTTSFAQARFGVDQVHSAARIRQQLPMDWNIQVLAAIEALSHLNRGLVTVSPKTITVRGVSFDPDASAEVAKLFSTRLGQNATYALAITYEEPPQPKDQPLTSEACQSQLNLVQDSGKIAFEPGSATVASGSSATLDQVALVLEHCGPVQLEIQGHTDSQGRESMNERLSQSRAQSILNELRSRRIPTLTFVARGYGETQPIADNDTEEGREANRRIVFQVLNAEEPETEEPAASNDETLEPTQSEGDSEGSNP